MRHIADDVVYILNVDFVRIWMTKSWDLYDSGYMHAKIREGSHVCVYRDRCLHLFANSERYTRIYGDHRRVPFGCYKIGRVVASVLTFNIVHYPKIAVLEYLYLGGEAAYGEVVSIPVVLK